MSISNEINRIRNDRNYIRNKLAELGIASDSDNLDELSRAINQIYDNGAFERTLDTTTIAYAIPKGYHNGNGKIGITLETKTAIPTKSEQEIRPTSGKVLSRVTVEPIPDSYVKPSGTLSITENGTHDVTEFASAEVNVPSGGIDTSDATATAEDMAEGVTAYVNGEKVTGTVREAEKIEKHEATVQELLFVSIGSDGSATGLNGTYIGVISQIDDQDGKAIISPGTELRQVVDPASFGDATAEDVAAGKTFTSADGLKVEGTHVCESGIDTSDATATAEDMAEGVTAYVNGEKVTGTLKTLYSAAGTPSFSGDKVYLKYTGSTKYLMKSGTMLNTNSSEYGDATAEDVAAGKTFTSAAGLKVTGTHECSVSTPTLQSKTVTPSESEQMITPDSGYDGLSSVVVNGDANLVASNIKSGVSIFGVAGTYEGSSGIQAQHITSADEAITISGSGTVKVWGYGYKSGSYTGTTYSFVGDGYYSGSYGTPSKTSSTFSISNGKLSGLPSGLTSLDVLVTIGI